MSIKILKYITSFLLILTFTNCKESIIESVESIEDNKNTEVISTFSDIQANIFDKSCAFSGCHGSNSINPDLSGNSHANIVNKSSSTGINYITPNDPVNSYLLQKLMSNGNYQGSQMPRGSSPLSEEQIDAIIMWINDGAQNN